MYTVKETAQLVELYNEGKGSLPADIAETLGKTEKSVIGKLVNLKLYVAKPRVSKVTGGLAETKVDIAKDVAELLEVELPDLEKAPKTTLLKLRKAVSEWLGESED